MNPTISDEQIARIEDAIRVAEQRTSGELRVHIEENRPSGQTALVRAVEVFRSLGMEQTAQRNGVLFYVATETRDFAVIGDAGIDQVVPAGFWDEVKNRVLTAFRQARYADGLADGIGLAGEQLARYFPYDAAIDQNELPDTISRG
jgi:uncharacterized membrane protein